MSHNGASVCNGKAVAGVPCADQKLRVLLWTDSDQFAGTERHNCELENGLRSLGIRVRMACPVPSPLSRAVSSNGGVVVPLSCKGRRTFPALLQLRRWLRSQEVEVIHAHNGRTALLGALACWWAGRGILVVSQHFIHPARSLRRGLRKWASCCIHRWMSGRVAHWIAVSEAVRRQMLLRGDAPGERVSVVHNGLECGETGHDLESAGGYRRTALVSQGPVIVCVARLAPEKGHETLLRALAILRAEGCSFCVWMVGEGELRRGLERQVETLGLGGQVVFAGHQSDPGMWIEAADLLVLASPEEPFGLVLLEAMIRRKPVVAARAGGPCEIVDDQRSGLLFLPGDARDLAMKLRVLLEQKAVRRLMGEAGFERWRGLFGAETMSVKTVSVYHAALQRRGTSSGVTSV